MYMDLCNLKGKRISTVKEFGKGKGITGIVIEQKEFELISNAERSVIVQTSDGKKHFVTLFEITGVYNDGWERRSNFYSNGGI